MEDVSEQSTSAASSPPANSNPAPSPQVTMTEQAPFIVDEFLSTGRTGRRNALGDILDKNTAFITTADLPDQLQSLSFGSDQCAASTSSCMLTTASTSSTHPSPSTSSSQSS